jgi:hypothetical protein|nr:MAG TPA: hypothetical protein [Caudoviricetes sp.]
MIRIIIVYAVIVLATILHASTVRATEAAYRGAVAANWCNYLGPDCRPHGLSPRAYNVFRYLVAPEGMTGVQRYEASREILFTEDSVARGDAGACKEIRDIAKAMRQSPSPDVRRWGRSLFDLAGQKCD